MDQKNCKYGHFLCCNSGKKGLVKLEQLSHNSGYGIGFDSRSEFSLPDGSIEKNVNTFGANMSSSVHIDNKYIYILVPSEGPTRESNDTTTLTAEAEYLIYFTQSGKRFVQSLR